MRISHRHLSPDKTKLGYCDTIEEILIGESKVLRFSGCQQNEACTIVLRGANLHILGQCFDCIIITVWTALQTYIACMKSLYVVHTIIIDNLTSSR